MEVMTREQEHRLTVKLSGDLDHHAAKATVAELELALERRVPTQLVLDFADVTFMDSSGIAVVLRAQRRMTALGGCTVLQSVPKQAQKVFDAAGITRYVTIE